VFFKSELLAHPVNAQSLKMAQNEALSKEQRMIANQDGAKFSALLFPGVGSRSEATIELTEECFNHAELRPFFTGDDRNW